MAVRAGAALVLLAALGGCAGATGHLQGVEDPEVSAAIDRRAAPEAIAVCHGYGCGVTDLVTIAGEWPAIRALFAGASHSPQAERAAVARAVAMFEQAAGRQLGTWRDEPATPFSRNDPGQLDCVDESVNTTSFLLLLAREGLLRWHTVAEPARRHAFLAFGVHFTAVVVERDGGARYAVDSWFHGNGEPPEIVDLARWRAGWRPAEPGPR